MPGRREIAWGLLLVAAGCAPLPAPRIALPAPTPPPPATPPSLATRLRQEAWLTRFWEQLTPTQRRRVLARMRRGQTPVARTEAEAAPIWDGLGLPERNALVFGPGLPRAAATSD